MNVLLVDDEPMMRKMIKMALQRRGFQVFDAASAVDALSLVEKNPVDILVTDIVMNDMDGWTLARSLEKGHPGLPVLFISGYPIDFEDVCRKYARSAFLLKPFGPGELMAAISGLVAAGTTAA